MILKNNKARSIWQKLSASDSFNKMVSAYRETFFVPKDGFDNEKDYKKWLSTLVKDEKLNLESLRSMAKIRSHDWGYDLSGMEYVIYDFIHYGKVKNQSLDSVNNSGCAMYFITPSNREWVKNRLEDGIYIKIGENSRATDIELFLKSHKLFLESFQKVFAEINNNKKVVSKTKYKQSINTSRDNWIHLLGQLDIKKLNEFSGSTSTYKDINIATIMNNRGFKIEPENIRQILHRQKKLIRDK